MLATHQLPPNRAHLFTYDFKNVTPGFPRVRIRLGRRRDFC